MSLILTKHEPEAETPKDKYIVVCQRTSEGMAVSISSDASSDELMAIAECLNNHAAFKKEPNPTIH